MKIPSGMTEREVTEIVNNIARRLANNYTFGYNKAEDITQEIWLIAIDGLERYDGKRPLENFLFVHVRNRLSNLKRDKYSRRDIPCHGCEFYRKNGPQESKCAAFTDRMDCKEFAQWKHRNQLKKELVSSNFNMITAEYVPDKVASENEVSIREIKSIIDKKIDITLRPDYLRMQSGVSVPKHRREQVENAIKSIIAEFTPET